MRRVLCAFIWLTVSFPALAAAAPPQTSQFQVIRRQPAPEPIASLNSFTPADQRILPMPLAERIRSGAVPSRGMCSTVPATSAPNALISGDGKMWVDVFGDPLSEQVIFHQERILQPWKGAPLDAPKIAAVLPEVRKLMLGGEYKKGLDLSLAAAEKTSTKPDTDNLRPNPAFDMRIDMGKPHAIHDYLRTTDFESGEVKVAWADNNGVWTRRTFVSRPDNAVVQLLTAPAGAAMNATLELDTWAILHPRPSQPSRIAYGLQSSPLHEPGADQIRFTRAFDPHHLVLEGRYVVENGNPGYVSVTRMIANGGSVRIANNAVVLEGVHSLLLITRIRVYANLQEKDADALKEAVDQIPTDYQTLLDRHRPGQTRVMDRVSVDFGGKALHSMSGEELLTDQRTRFGFNPALLEDLFDMGRYWLYARTGDFPPMWGHININVNLQNSSAVMGDLPESTMAYTHWVESLLPDARTNAANIFGARGVLFGIHPTVEGDPLTHFAYSWPHHYWISGAGWMYSPMWDYYLATGVKTYLRQHILPGLLQIAQFYEDYLKVTDKNGNYIFVPSYSPENWPANTHNAPTIINATMDISVCQEVFTHLIEAAQVLHVDSENVPRWKVILAKLPPYMTDSDGALKEWAWPTIEEYQDHRHVSHLYGAWPADEFTPDTAPELAKAALLAARKRAQGNASAHGLLHRSLAAARLKDPYLVNFDLKQILEQGYVNPGLTTMHNPYRFPAPDPQGALPTLIMEMLVYSRPGVIGLLPAIPASLSKGSIKGVLCRTQAKIDDLTWDLQKRTIQVTISSQTDQTIRLFVRRGIESIEAPAGALVALVHAGSAEFALNLSASHPTTLKISIGDQDPLRWATAVHPEGSARNLPPTPTE